MSMANKVLQLIQESGAKWVDFRFTDTKGKEQHVTYPADTIDEDTFEDGKMFDGSSIAGWKGIEASDMILRPDAATGFIDPFFAEPTVVGCSKAITVPTLKSLAKILNSLSE
jgi:glutamine synthetase